MPVRIVQSKENSRIKQLRRALASPPRPSQTDGSARRAESTEFLVGIEGPNLLAEAVRAKLRIECVFVAQGRESLLDGIGLSPDTEILAVPRPLLDSVLATETPQPVAALLEPPQWNWNDLCGQQNAGNALLVVLAGLQDPGNLGTIVRSAEAFGAGGLVTLPGTASPWNPKAVRASAGSVFRLPLLAADPEDCFQHLRQAGVRVLTTAVTGADAADRLNLALPVALIIGNEGNGVPPEIAAHADAAITIPCPGPVESLNASVAASILLYEAARLRSARGGAA